jgi:hypothetical protein
MTKMLLAERPVFNTVEEEPRVKVLVCGGRKYADNDRLRNELDALHAMIGITDLAHGAADGADTLAGEWARENGIRVHAFPAQWTKHGKAAGPIRNELMYKTFQPDLVVAFPGGNGTRHMCDHATLGGTNVRYVR